MQKENKRRITNIHEAENQPRKPGYWEVKVLIAEDFDELPENIADVFRGESKCTLLSSHPRESALLSGEKWMELSESLIKFNLNVIVISA